MSLIPIKELFHFEKGSLQSSKCTPGDFNFITAASDWKTHNEYSHECEALIFAAAASGSLGRTHYVNGKFISSDLCFILTPKDPKKYPIDLKFYHLIFQAFKDEIVRNTKSGTSKEAIGLTVFGKYKLPYFDIDKQQEVKEQFVSAQESTLGLDTELTHQLDLVKQLRQAFLREAMQGKLVLQDPNDELASVLLKKIKAEKERLIKEKKIKKQKPLPLITQDEIPFEVPENWVWCRLGELANHITDGEHQTPPRIKEGRMLLSAKNVRDGYFDFDNVEFISEEHFQKSMNRCKPELNDVLIVSVGATIGRSAVLKEEKEFALVRSVALIKPQEKSMSGFIKYVLDSPLLQNDINTRSWGTAQPCLYLNQIKELSFPLPPLFEQLRIVAKLDELMAYCDELEKSIKESQQQNELLLQQVLREALEPKNVEQV